MDTAHLIYAMQRGAETTEVYDTLAKLREHVKISTHHPAPIKEMLETCDMGDSTHIIGPWYSPSAGNDFQMAVTGKVQGHENPVTAMRRKLGEELGVFPTHPPALMCCHTVSKNDVTRYGWVCGLQHMTIITEAHKPPPIPVTRDSNIKIACIVHASEKDIHDLLREGAGKRWPHDNSISGIIALPIAMAREMIQDPTTRAAPGGTPCKSPKLPCQEKVLCNGDGHCEEVLICDQCNAIQQWSKA